MATRRRPAHEREAPEGFVLAEDVLRLVQEALAVIQEDLLGNGAERGMHGCGARHGTARTLEVFWARAGCAGGVLGTGRVRFVTLEPCSLCVNMFLEHIRVFLCSDTIHQTLFTEHYSSALLIGA